LCAARNTAERSCVGCRQVRPRDRLVRYVLAPDGRLLVDYRQRLPGRGTYTCPDRACIASAVKRGQFSRAFRRSFEGGTAEELVASLTEQLRETILGLLGLARKAGQVLSGSNLVLDALGGKEVPVLVLIARDASEGIAGKVAGKADAVGAAHWRCFDKETLGRLLGREERSVVAVKAHPLAEKLKKELIRYTHIAGEN